MDRSQTLAYLAESLRGAWTKPFRGQIHEYAGKLVLGPGYAVKGPIQILTLRHLLEPLEALRDPTVRLMSVRGAVQTTKSLLADIFVPYCIEHDPGDILWLLEDEGKAREYADRCMGLIKSIPEIDAMLKGIEHHNKTKAIIRFKHMKLQICGLNEGNVQSLSWRYVILDETWLHPFDGLIRQAMDRTKQYPDTKKILLLSQGGWEEDDHDRVHKETDQRELHYSCPHCGWCQPYELSIERRPIEPQTEIQKPEIKYSGLGWDTNETTKANGRWDAEAASLTAHHVCFRCAGRMDDTPSVRSQLAESTRYVPAGKDPNDPQLPRKFPFPAHVGFHWPGEASTRLPFRDQVKKYLIAKTAADEQAYKLPLQEFYQKDRGLPWSESITHEQRVIIHEPYDVLTWSEEAFRPLIVDCQRDLKKFFYHAYAVSKAGEARMLDRGELDSFEAIAEKQKEHGIRDQQVFLDCGYEMTKVLRECVKHGHVQTLRGGRKVWACWFGLKGSGIEIFRHERKVKGNTLYDWRIYSKVDYYNINIGHNDRHPRAPWFSWSNIHCKDLLRARRDGDPNCPKLRALPDTLAPTNLWSYHAQMRSEYRKEDFVNGRKRSIYEPINKTRPNHDWDISAMLMAFMAFVGIIGAAQAPPAEDTEK